MEIFARAENPRPRVQENLPILNIELSLLDSLSSSWSSVEDGPQSPINYKNYRHPFLLFGKNLHSVRDSTSPSHSPAPFPSIVCSNPSGQGEKSGGSLQNTSSLGWKHRLGYLLECWVMYEVNKDKYHTQFSCLGPELSSAGASSGLNIPTFWAYKIRLSLHTSMDTGAGCPQKTFEGKSGCR